MTIQPKHVKCIQIPQNGTTGLAEPYKSFFVTNIKTTKFTHNRFGGGTFEMEVQYNNRNVDLFSKIETIPTFVVANYSLDHHWDTETVSPAPHPMPMVVETYGETHNLEENIHTITISGRGVLDVLLSNKVVIPKLTYQSPVLQTVDRGFLPWDILVDIFGRNINGELTPTGGLVTEPVMSDDLYLKPQTLPALTDLRFVPNISFLHEIEPSATDPYIERVFECDNLLEIYSSYITTYNLYVCGKMRVDALGFLHFDYVLRRLTDLTMDTATPLIYDYGAMPPKSYNVLLSTEQNRVVLYAKLPELIDIDAGTIFTVNKGDANAEYRGWFCKELFNDMSSLPFIASEDSQAENNAKMIAMAAADELYKSSNMLIKVTDTEYLYSPMEYYANCWPGCKYSSIGPDDVVNTLVITSFVFTGSKQDGWIITPELIHDIPPGWTIKS